MPIFKSNPIAYNDNIGKRNPFTKGDTHRYTLIGLTLVAFLCGVVLG